MAVIFTLKNVMFISIFSHSELKHLLFSHQDAFLQFVSYKGKHLDSGKHAVFFFFDVVILFLCQAFYYICMKTSVAAFVFCSVSSIFFFFCLLRNECPEN